MAIRVMRSPRSEEHTSELQSHLNLVCRLLLEKKNSASVLSGAARCGATFRAGELGGPAFEGAGVIDVEGGAGVLADAGAADGFYFFFNDTATTDIYTLSLHDALPISFWFLDIDINIWHVRIYTCFKLWLRRSEEHTSELQSHLNLVCRLLLEKKN